LLHLVSAHGRFPPGAASPIPPAGSRVRREWDPWAGTRGRCPDRPRAGDSLAAAAQALDQTSTSFDGFAKSLDDAKASSAHASQLLNDASATSAQLADAMGINFLGAQPFLPISQSFRRNTDELRGVAADVSTLSEAIGHNSRDVTAVRDSVRVLRDRVQQLANDAQASPDGRRIGPELGVVAYGLTLWLGVLALLSLLGGFALLRI